MSKQQTSTEKRWYVLHTYSGYEDAVAKNLKQRVESLGMEDKIFNIIVPKEKKIKIRNGKKRTIEEKIYPGYVLVEMIVTDDSWYVVRNTPNVTGFVGSGTIPLPVSEVEINSLKKRMIEEEPKYTIDFKENDLVRITDGPFKDSEGKVSGVDGEKGKVKVMINMFGRDTPLELDSLQIKKNRLKIMAKEIKAIIKLHIQAGKANPAPPVGPALASQQVNIAEFCKAFNDATKDLGDFKIPVDITVHTDKSYTFKLHQPPAAQLIKKALGLEKGSGNKKKVGKITKAQLEEIAKQKMSDLNTNDMEQAVKILSGTARSLGIDVI